MEEENKEVVEGKEAIIKKESTSIIKKLAKKNRKLLSKIGIVVIVVLFLVVGFFVGSKIPMKDEDKVGNLTFKDVGKLATQEGYVTVVGTIDKNRKIYAIDIPLTQSICVFSIDVIVSAGYDFAEIVPEIVKPTETENGKIIIKLPLASILYCNAVAGSQKKYYESESIFTNINFDDYFGKENDLVNKAKTNAVKNGLLERARENAKTVLSSFILSVIGDEPYDIIFEDIGEIYY